MKNTQTNKGGIVLWIIVILGILGVIFATTKLASNTNKNTEEDTQVQILEEDITSDWTKGNIDSSVTLVEYADFQCPACGAYYPIVKKLSEEFDDRVKFVFRHFPLRQIHPNANIAAIAAESAGAQGKFWEMHDIIFENQNTWSRQRSSSAKKIFISYAKKLELNIEKFESDTKSKEMRKIVDDSYRGATKAGVNSTPTFLLNGEKILAPRSYEDFKKLLEEKLSTKNTQVSEIKHNDVSEETPDNS